MTHILNYFYLTIYSSKPLVLHSFAFDNFSYIYKYSFTLQHEYIYEHDELINILFSRCPERSSGCYEFSFRHGGPRKI